MHVLRLTIFSPLRQHPRKCVWRRFRVYFAQYLMQGFLLDWSVQITEKTSCSVSRFTRRIVTVNSRPSYCCSQMPTWFSLKCIPWYPLWGNFKTLVLYSCGIRTTVSLKFILYGQFMSHVVHVVVSVPFPRQNLFNGVL